MFSFLSLLFPARYESRSMLGYYVRAQYGPFLKKNPTVLFEGFYQKILSRADSYIHAGTRAADIGCGTGRLPFEYARLGATVCGTETSNTFVDFCERLKRNEVEEVDYLLPETKPVFVKDDICASILPSASFDFVSCLNVIDRVSDPVSAIASIERVLAPGGISFIASPYDWELSPAPSRVRVSDIKELLRTNVWTIEAEERLAYRIPTGTEYREYDCHLVIARKK